MSCVVLLPLDVYNNSGVPACEILGLSCGSIDFYTIWSILFYLVVIMIAFFVPFTIFFYETDSINEPPLSKRVKGAIGPSVIALVVMVVLCAVFYLLFRHTNVDVESITISDLQDCFEDGNYTQISYRDLSKTFYYNSTSVNYQIPVCL